MIWDAKQRRYEDENGRPLTPAEIHAYLEEFIQSEKLQVRQKADALFDQQVTVEEFFAFMRQKIRAWHGTAGQIAYGGEAQMNA